MSPGAIDQTNTAAVALLSKPPARPDSVVEVGGIVFDWERGQVRRLGRDLRLAPKEFYLLGLLITNPGKIMSRQQIMRVVWSRSTINPRTVDVIVGKLRSSLNRGGVPDPIRTILGYGYKFSEDFEQEHSRWLARGRKKLRLKG
jgi:two-component system phosphate regulon response regulator PhoB